MTSASRPLPARLLVGTRGSPLALRQAEIVAERVRARHPGIEVRVATVAVRGEGDLRPFRAIGGTGLFTSELERAVVEGLADLAVHSAKDLPTRLHPETAIVCIPERARVEDVFVGGAGGTGEERVMSLPRDAVVGTSSMRRRALLANLRPELRVIELRGNVDTRLRKIGAEVEGAVLAAAGIDRLEIADLALGVFDPFVWTPAPGQGALAVQARSARTDVRELFRELNDEGAAAEVAAERAFTAALEGGCSAPLGCLGRVGYGTIEVTGFIATANGSHLVRDTVRGDVEAAAELGRALAQRVLSYGGREIVGELKTLDAPPITAP